MLDNSRLVAQTVLEEPLEATQIPAESGLAYVRVQDANGNAVVKPSTGAANELFAGLAVMDKISTATGVRWMDVYTVANSDTASDRVITLPDATISNFAIYAADGVTPLTVTTDYTITGNVISFTATQKGATVKVCYNYPMTLAQLQMAHVNPIPSASAQIGSIGLTKGLCQVYVNNFDPSKLYSVTGANSRVALGANGILTIGGTGTVIGQVIKVPTAADPFLGIEFVAGK